MDTDQNVLQPFLQANSWLEEFPSFKSHLEQNFNPASDVFHEVNELIRGLNLEEFREQKSQPRHHEQSQAKNAGLGTSSDPEQRKLEHSHSVNGLSGPRGDTLTLPFISSTRFLSRPPETSISDISVLTRVTNMNGTYQPIQEKPSRRKFSFNSLHSRAKNHAKGTPTQNQEDSTPNRDGRPGLLLKRNSLVGQNLPIYIQEQLRQISIERELKKPEFNSRIFEQAPLKTSGTAGSEKLFPKTAQPKLDSESKDSKFDSRSTKPEDDRYRPDQRINNLLSNSVSFHQHQGQSGPELSLREAESPITEAELEYILPNLLTKSIEYLDPSYLNSEENSADEYDENADSSSAQDDELFFSKVSDN